MKLESIDFLDFELANCAMAGDAICSIFATQQERDEFWEGHEVDEEKLRKDAEEKLMKDAEIKSRVERGIQFLHEKSIYSERQAFEPDEDFDMCRVAHIDDGFQKVAEAFNRRMPCLVLLEMSQKEIAKRTEIYLPEIEVFGVVDEIDEDNNMCTLKVLAVGLDAGGYETPMQELIEETSLDELKNMWLRLDAEPKCHYLSDAFGKRTSWQIFKGSMVPHDYKEGIDDITNMDLYSLLHNDKATYEALCEVPNADFNFKFVPGPPGCGKTYFMLETIQNNPCGRFAIIAHSNHAEKELFHKLEERENIMSRRVFFLGKSLAGEEIPINWEVCQPNKMETETLQEIVNLEGILVVGTVKKFDDLRKRCKAILLDLRFNHVLHDEFARHTWLELFTVAKVAESPCAYKALGDRKQTKGTIEKNLFQQPATSSHENTKNYKASLEIQNDVWKRYEEVLDNKKKQGSTGRKILAANLMTSMQIPEKLNKNRRSHPDIVVKVSNAFYHSEMKPAEKDNKFCWKEPEDFPLRELQNRVIFVHVDSANDAKQTKKGAWRNDAELLQANNLQMALMDLGIQKEDILLLAAYSLQADRIKGLSVAASQGSERRVVIYTMTCYGKATESSGRQSLRGDILNTAVTRGQSLVFIVGDTVALKKHITLEYGTRQLLNSCPVIPAEYLLPYLESRPFDCGANLQYGLDNVFKSDKKKRGHTATKADRRQNKRINAGNYTPEKPGKK